jgi:MFS family permease
MTKRFYAKYIDERTIHLITFLGFIFGLSTSLLTYITSSYFKEVTQSDHISIFYIIAFGIVLISLFNLNKLIEGFGRARTLMVLLFVQVGILFGLQFVDINIAGAMLLMAYIILFSVILVVFDVVLEAYSKDAKTGHIRGLFLSVWNFGFLIGPIISMYILQHYGFNSIFFITMILYVVMFLIIFMMLNDITGHVKKQNLSILQTIKKFKENRNLINIYWLSFTLRFFYAVLTVYMPIYLRDVGLSWTEIGFIFTIMLIPFILIEYPAGVLADKKYGEKEMLLIGSVIIICSVVAMFFMKDASIITWMWVLFISRVGAALLESMQDSYFYKQIDANDVALINVFRSTRSIAYIVSAMFVGFALWIVDDMRIMFVILFIVLVIGLYPVLTLKDTK